VIAAHLSADPLLARQIDSAPGLRVPGAFDVFELATRAVLGQQISVSGATTLSGRIVRAFGEASDTPFAGVSHHFPTPQRLAGLQASDIAAIGMPTARADTLRNLASFAIAGGLDMAPGTTLDDALARLRTVRGIGEWTAQYIAMRALRFPDAFPAGDLGLQKAGVETKDGARLTEKQLLARAAHWSPWRAYAALLLWHSLK
jgi:AraC family transcriptional regulator of adaptative response / DNA-3-methyladenine glycosylase II